MHGCVILWVTHSFPYFLPFFQLDFGFGMKQSDGSLKSEVDISGHLLTIE